jgi:hypothetical protein
VCAVMPVVVQAKRQSITYAPSGLYGETVMKRKRERVPSEKEIVLRFRHSPVWKLIEARQREVDQANLKHQREMEELAIVHAARSRI